MVRNADLVAARLAEIPRVTRKTGVLVERVGSGCRVNVGSSSVVLPFVGMALPPAGAAVQLELRDDQLVVTGPATPLPSEGTITAVNAPRATVTAWGVNYTLRYRDDYTPVIGHLVSILWAADGEGIIQYKISASSSTVAPGANPSTGVQTFHPSPFLATGSGSYRAGNGWFTNDVYASASNDGAFWYGSKVRNTIPDTAAIASARIYLPIRAVNVNAPGQMRLHTDNSKPGGAPNFSGSAVAVPARSGWVSVPLSWINYLKSNAGGIGFDGGGYWIIKAIGSDRQSGALDIVYRA